MDRIKMETISVTKPNLGNDIGLFSGNRVIIHIGKDSNVIQLEDIKRINLTKKRRFEVNILFVSLALTVAVILLYDFELGIFQKQAFVVLILAALAMSIFYKSYFYQIDIDLKDHESLIVKKGGFYKKQIKNFYFSLRKRLRKEHLEPI